MDEQNQDMRQNDLFTGDEAREIAEANAPQPPGASALERAAQRIAGRIGHHTDLLEAGGRKEGVAANPAFGISRALDLPRLQNTGADRRGRFSGL